MSKVISFTNTRNGSRSQHDSTDGDYDAERSCNAALNALFCSLAKDENCKRLRAFPEGYCREYGLSLEQIHAVTDLDVLRLLKLGVTPGQLERLTGIYGLSLEGLCFDQNGKSPEEILTLLAHRDSSTV